jgi:serine/threonine protein kinase
VEARTIGNYVKEDISFVDFKRLVIVLLNALVYVHSKSVAIGALTPETIFITPNERVIFMDFSQSRLQDVAYTCIKSMPVDVYRSPESVYEPWMVSELSDVFSMGMILKRLIDTTHLTIQFHYAEIIEKMTRVRMQDRPKLQDVLNWINT